MPITLQEFAGECHAFLKADPGPKGREKVRRRLEDVLKDDAFVAANLGPDNNQSRSVIYKDPEIGFLICAHVHEGATAGGRPHDHGASWAIYGQAHGHTDMTEYRVVSEGKGTKGWIVASKETYRLERGMARTYNERDVHSTRRDGETRLIRIEGPNISSEDRRQYESTDDAATA